MTGWILRDERDWMMTGTAETDSGGNWALGTATEIGLGREELG